MATRRPHPHPDKPAWWHAFIPVVATIIGAVLAIGVPASYYFSSTQAVTQQKLVDHDNRFTDQGNDLKAIKEKLQEIKKADDEGRTRVRDEFLKKSEETAKGIADLNTRAAVSETKLSQMVESLKDISSQLKAALPQQHGGQR